MRLALLTQEHNDITKTIFCRGCDAGASRKGASRDLDSEGKIDLYCDRCTRIRSTHIVPDAGGDI